MTVNDEVFKYYFYFVQERMQIFWLRYQQKSPPFTTDPILCKSKFTNVYRAQDRVSQYLIKEVIYRDKQFSDLDILFRILLFKIFNNIDTWKFLESEFGDISIGNFSPKHYSHALSNRIKLMPIFSAAYMMSGTHAKYHQFPSKHEKWLSMVERELISEKRLDRILQARSLDEVYTILLTCSFIGEFLAYQYAIDFNYSEAINFDENSFVKAGIGAVRGIKKCFTALKTYSFEDCIRYTQENFQYFQKKYGYDSFRPLFDRQPTLIDLQNCFCETDKYLRVKLPHLVVDNVRIKQKFKQPKPSIEFFFPPKWGINKYIEQCSVTNSKELTLF